MNKIILLLGVALLLSTSALAGDYQYISAADLQQQLASQQAGVLLDIQVENEYAEHHIPGAVATYAYPVKSAADRSKLEPLLAQVKNGAEPIVIICPRGGGGAKRTYDYLKEQGVAEPRLKILSGGQARWPS